VTTSPSTPEKVWQALTDPAFTRQYFGGFSIEVEPRTGGAFCLRQPDGRVHMSGRVVEWSPPRRFSCTWLVEGMPEFRDLPCASLPTRSRRPAAAVKLTMTEAHSWDIPDAILQAGAPAGPRFSRVSRACWKPANRWT
jgi:uncharacterized protein YndB with AHSA1/START domain